MATFSYTAKDQKGIVVEGVMEADARNAVVQRLQQMGYFPVRINASGKRPAPATKAAEAPATKASSPRTTTMVSKTSVARSGKAEPRAKAPAAAAGSGASSGVEGALKSFKSRKITTAEIAGFNRQLADLIGAGIPLVKSLAILSRQTENEKLKAIIADILDDVQGGATFADSLNKHPKVFSKLFVAMVKSGEAGGMLDEVLNRLADMSEAEEQLKGKVKSALAYPVVMIIAGIGAMFILFSYVIPRITGTFEQLGQALPVPTQILIATSHWFQNYWWLVIAAAGISAVSLAQFIKTPDGRMMWHRMQLRLPIFGPLVQKREVARFARTLGSLLRNGVSILTALDIVREVQNNSVFRSEIDRVVEEITQGSTISRPLADSNIFPTVAVNMIAIGEETGRLPEVLIRISESFETQVDRLVRSLTSLIEPLIICVMGVVVGAVVISMLLPIFSMDPTGSSR